MRVLKRFLGRVPKGKPTTLILDERDKFTENLCNFEGKDVWLEIYPVGKQRSIQQNRYLFGVVIEVLVNETEDFGGWDSYNVYGWLEWKFLNDYPDDGGPREWVRIKDLSTVNFEELMTKIREWASVDLGCCIPEPNEAIVFGEPIITGHQSEH